MRTDKECDEAREQLAFVLAWRPLTDVQRATYHGMQIALQWMANDPMGQPLEDLVRRERAAVAELEAGR